LQETKKVEFDSAFIRGFAPKRFDQFVFSPSEGASVGILVLWASNAFKGEGLMCESFGVVVKFTAFASDESFFLVNVYGPCEGEARDNFVAWLCHLDIADDAMWLLVRDFNFIDIQRVKTERVLMSKIFVVLMKSLVIWVLLNCRLKVVHIPGVTCNRTLY
jgi:hypothetical protein